MNNRKFLRLFFVFSLIFSLYKGNINGLLPDVQSSCESIVFAEQQQEEILVIPGGKSVGVILSTDGVMVVNVAEMETAEGNFVSPAKDAGLKSGDLIKSFNGKKISSVSDLCSAVNNSSAKASKISINRNGKTIEMLISPEISKETNTLKIGAWVKDAASGIGTITYYVPSTGVFAALGHGICDPQTGNLISVDGGNILNSTIASLEKGKKGVPGELKGVFSENQEFLGTITQNNICGIFGIAEKNLALNNTPIPIAKKEMVHTGEAYILANVEGNITEKFNVKITRVMPQNNPNPKGLILEITDSKLIEKTGGIIQGMSGSPIIQDGKLVGAITHVFVNDPTKGYGIFAEWMTESTKTIGNS